MPVGLRQSQRRQAVGSVHSVPLWRGRRARTQQRTAIVVSRFGRDFAASTRKTHQFKSNGARICNHLATWPTAAAPTHPPCPSRARDPAPIHPACHRSGIRTASEPPASTLRRGQAWVRLTRGHPAAARARQRRLPTATRRSAARPHSDGPVRQTAGCGPRPA